jgi:pyrroline-5-carboxylate reductase
MGGSMLDGWLATMNPAGILVVEPEPTTAATLSQKKVTVVANADAIPAGAKPDVVIFAVKPQVMEAVVPAYARFVAAKPLFLSIAAGTTTAFFAKRLGAEAAVVRSMPNLPASVHRGITGAFATPKVGADQKSLAERLLGAVGEVVWVDEEGLLDAVTAVSGSGPAYVFLLAECLAQAGIEAGLPEELAARLARATVAGSGELLARSTEPAETLRRNVTSPGGTTAAALSILMGAGGFQTLLSKAVAAAAERSRQLAQ